MVAGSPEIVLTCADCGTEGPIAGTRWVDHDLPHQPLCAGCFDFAGRFLDARHLRALSPASDTDEHGVLWVRRLCPRCGGTGVVPPYPGTCFRCWGYRWTYVSPRNVNQVMKASATFQANRIPASQKESP